MKTVIHKGKEYQIGAVYEFTSNGNFSIDVLLGIHTEGANKGMFTCVNGDYAEIREVLRLLGTIKEAPIELEDGAAYQFDYSEEIKTGILFRGLFVVIGNGPYHVEPLSCTNIVKLVPEVK